ncbi:MurR/RpiR family transcriptional regulator [Evansella halocellulosilytica]|uniref:MurR/RpiR family transcriptional regulator n=1 Tax=Evansella halocellulosilytica TaxID=2011013 RepID=UPI000BB93A99|nr:MurR/RpiR family transcriptional regulator [Evansella halocellulosilytica]
MDKIKLQIKNNYHNLTKRLQKIANFIIENPKLIALYPAKEIGNLTETSETTVIRCCNSLGYSGYTAVQEEIRKALLMPENDPLKELTEGIKSDNGVFYQTMNQDVYHIRQTFEELGDKRFKEAVNEIVNANKIIVVGLRTSHAPAQWISYSLNIIRGKTVLFKGDIDDANYLLTDINDEDLIISLSFQRYSQQTISFSKAAKEKGAKILCITDDELSPIGLIADITIKAITPKPTSLKGMPTIFSILNALITGVMSIDNEKVEARIEQYNHTNEFYYSYYRNEN